MNKIYGGNRMGKTRIYEIAKELNMDSKVLMEKLDRMQISYKNHMSTLEEDVVKRLVQDVKKPQQTEQNIAKNGAKESKLMQNEEIKEEKTANQVQSNIEAKQDDAERTMQNQATSNNVNSPQ